MKIILDIGTEIPTNESYEVGDLLPSADGGYNEVVRIEGDRAYTEFISYDRFRLQRPNVRVVRAPESRMGKQVICS